MAETDSLAASNKLWPRSTSLFLLLVGVVLSLISVIVVLNMPDLPWHPDRDAELRATYDAYRDTGTLLIKPTGSGSEVTQAAVPGDWSSAAWDDDPGAYIVGSVMGGVTGASSPYPGLRIAMALLVALPLLWLPTAVARIFRRARAGYALILLPAVLWLVNGGTILVGTQYGLADSVSPLRVYALYGISAAMAFLSLSLVLVFSTYRLRWIALSGVSLLMVVLSGLGNLMSAYSGVGVAAAVGVLWWLNSSGRWRWARALGVSAAAVVLSIGVHAGAMGALDMGRAQATGQAVQELPVAHNTWHGLYIGLSFPEPVTGQPSTFDVPWSDEFAWEQARAVDPDVVVASAEYDRILRDLYQEQVAAAPLAAADLYLGKTLFVIKQFGAMIAFILVGFVIALMRRSPQRRLLGASIVIAAPTLIIGFAAPVTVMPTLYSFSALAAALGLLVAVSLGALVWSLTSMPSHVRAAERSRLSRRMPPRLSALDERSHTSVIVPTRNGGEVIADTVRSLAGALAGGDEIVVVENGSTDATTQVLDHLSAAWAYDCTLVVLHSAPGLGEALRTGVLASTGQWLLLTADDLPFGFSDYDQFSRLPSDVIVAVGSKAHPDSQVIRSWRRVVQSRIFRFLRAALLQSKVGDSQGTIWVDGEWARSFAMASREMGLMWTTELVLAAEQQGIAVREVPVSLSDAHETGSSRFRLSDAWQSVVGFIRLAVYKDDYVNEVWTRTPADEKSTAAVQPV